MTQTGTHNPAEFSKPRLHMICGACGSTEIRADAYAEWDAETQDWVLRSIFDHKVCETCESETTLLEINEADQLEIAGFGMVNDRDGARIAEPSETPDFYDVMVKTIPQNSEEILTLHEFDDLDKKAAAAKLVEMTALYPLAGIECLACDLGPDQ